MSPAPYYQDEHVALYHGDMRELVPQLDLQVDCVIADPPYGETSLTWDRWPDNWPDALTASTRSMWCFGSMRMFLDRGAEFGRWKLSQDVVWEKHNGSGFATDRFKRVHELATHWYRGSWGDVWHDTPTQPGAPRPSARIGGRQKPTHTGQIGSASYDYGETRLARSVLKVQSMHGRAIHPTEKPVEMLDFLLRYACPPGGLVLDPFAGSGSTAAAARLTGRRTVLIEADERYCEAIVQRLAQGTLVDLLGGPP